MKVTSASSSILMKYPYSMKQKSNLTQEDIDSIVWVFIAEGLYYVAFEDENQRKIEATYRNMPSNFRVEITDQRLPTRKGHPKKGIVHFSAGSGSRQRLECYTPHLRTSGTRCKVKRLTSAEVDVCYLKTAGRVPMTLFGSHLSVPTTFPPLQTKFVPSKTTTPMPHQYVYPGNDMLSYVMSELHNIPVPIQSHVPTYQEVYNTLALHDVGPDWKEAFPLTVQDLPEKKATMKTRFSNVAHQTTPRSHLVLNKAIVLPY